MSHDLAPPSSRRAVAFGWRTFLENPVPYLAVLGTIVLLWVVLELLVVSSQPLGKFVNIVLHAIYFVAASIPELAMTTLALDARDERSTTFRDAFRNSRKAPVHAVARLVFLLMAAGGLLLLILPGLRIISRYLLFGYAMLDDDLGPMEALHESAEITRGSLRRTLSLFVALLGLNVAGATILGLGLLATVPASWIAGAALYRGLESQRSP